MITEPEHLNSDFERLEYIQNLIIASVTGNTECKEVMNSHYRTLRLHLVDKPIYNNILPPLLKDNRDLNQIWNFMKQYTSYAERREYIWKAFNPLLDFLEFKQNHPFEKAISDYLYTFDSDGIYYAWTKALDRRMQDPEGAITMSRTILESVCKHILDKAPKKKISYDTSKMELSQLYKLTAESLNLSPGQHVEQIFKQILGGCSGVVNGLGSLRNKLGDAHGQGVRNIKPQVRHAELAVNLAGSMALFLIQTFEANQKNNI